MRPFQEPEKSKPGATLVKKLERNVATLSRRKKTRYELRRRLSRARRSFREREIFNFSLDISGSESVCASVWVDMRFGPPAAALPAIRFFDGIRAPF
jgi:hypothetical protein